MRVLIVACVCVQRLQEAEERNQELTQSVSNGQFLYISVEAIVSSTVLTHLLSFHLIYRCSSLLFVGCYKLLQTVSCS